MSGITSGIGLVSGLPTAQLIDSLIAAQSGPKNLLTARVAKLQSQRSGFLELSARLVALKGTTTRFADATFFNQFSAGSSNESILTATASAGALPGVIDLVVKSLVTSHQLISGGFPDADSTPIGVGQITIEIGAGKLHRPTLLGDLNGGAGVRRGRLEITDRAGNTAEIDLRGAVDVDEVVNLINTAGEINVRARVAGNHIVLEDLTGGAGLLRVVDLDGGHIAADLGISQSLAADTLIGADIIYLADATLLSSLNDSNGVRHNIQGEDFRITSSGGSSFTVSLVGLLDDNTRLEVLNNGNGVRLGTANSPATIRINTRDGRSGIVDLFGARTIGDIKERINAAVDENNNPLNVEVGTVGIGGVGHLTLKDNNDPPQDGEEEDEETESNKPEFSIEDVNGYAARDLGIADASTEGSYQGSGIHRVTTIGDMVRAINFAEGNDGAVVASLTANGIRLQDTTVGIDSLTVEALTDGKGGVSMAAADLGIEGILSSDYSSRHLLAGLNTVLLHSLDGGSGLNTGEISFTARDGSAPVVVDLSTAQTVQDLINLINDNVSGISASINAVGNGIAVTDLTGESLNNLEVADVTGTMAADLGIAGSVDQSSIAGGNLQLQYITELTELEDLNGGRGVRAGTIQFQNTTGAVFTASLDEGDTTFGRVIDSINTAGANYGIVASINSTGDGIVITDTNGGSETLTITDVEGGSAAADLRIAGQASTGAAQIDGSFELRIEVDADDTLEDVAAKLRDASPDLNASVINDGASASPYRLSLTSGVSGSRGEILFDAGTTGLDMSTLVAAQDAVVMIGGKDAVSPIVVINSTNVISDVVPGVEIDLVSVSDETVTVSTVRDIERIVSDVDAFVTNYNAVMDRIDELTSFDPETEERGLLLGDATAALIESRLARAVIGRFEHAPPGTQLLASVGITFGNNARLSFDESVFREKYAEDPQAVEQLFTAEEVGVGAVLDKVLEGLTSDTDGVLARRDDILGEQVDDLNDRIEALEDQLSRRREQLERQFANLESVLAGLQGQQDALSLLAALAESRS